MTAALEIESPEVAPHYAPHTLGDRLALGMVRMLRFFAPDSVRPHTQDLSLYDSAQRQAPVAGMLQTIEAGSEQRRITMNADIPSRRLVLRGVLAAGCGLCLPLVLSGCDSKPGAGSPPAGAAPPSPAPVAAEPAAAGAKKATQAGVQYQLQPKGEQKCSNCRHFIAASNSCVLVEGQISPDAWCIIWAKPA